jgi:Protein of unknown function (DUF3352)
MPLAGRQVVAAKHPGGIRSAPRRLTGCEKESEALPQDPSPSSSHPPRAIALTICALLLAGIVAGALLLLSGGSSPSTGTTADPARIVPASAPLYAGADVRPNGSKKTAALADGRAFTQQADPYLRLLEVLRTPGSPVPDFNRDVAPWLGPRAGIFLSSPSSTGDLLALLQQGLLGGASATGAFPFGAGRAQGAIVLDTTDLAKARAFVNAAAAHAGAHASTYRGVAYQANAGDVAFAIVQRFVVIGSDSGIRATIDTTLGGTPLAGAPGYSALSASAPPRAVAHLYSNPVGAPSPSASSGLSGLLALFTGAQQTDLSLVPLNGSVALDLDTLASGLPGASVARSPFGSESARALAELPGESWLALGLADVGRTLPADVQAIRGLGSLLGSGTSASTTGIGLNLKALVEGLTAPLALLGADSPEARRDFQGWMGSAGIFASGTSLLEIKGAVVIDSKSAAASRAAVPRLGEGLRRMGGSVQSVPLTGTEAAVSARLPGLPVPLYIAAGRGASGQSKFVIGLGEASVSAALNPSSALESAPSYGAAAAAIGEGARPSVMLDVPTLLGLLEGIGLTEDPTVAQFLPYLRSLTTVAGGGHHLSTGVERFKLVLGLRPSTPAP